MSTDYSILGNLDKIEFAGAIQKIGGNDFVAGQPSAAMIPDISFLGATSYNVGYTGELVFNGTAFHIEANVDGTSTTYWSVDGGAQQSAVLPSGGFTFHELVSGLPAGDHHIRFTVPYYWTRAVRITGGSETIVNRPRGYGFFFKNLLTDQNYTCGDDPPCPSVYGTWFVQSGNSYNSAHPGLTYEHDFVGTGCELLTLSGGAGSDKHFAVSVDGGDWALVTISEPSDALGFMWIPIAKGLAHGTHAVKVMCLEINWIRSVRSHRGGVLSASASAADTSVTLASVAGISAGDWLQIGSMSGEEYRRVASIAGTTLTLTAAISKSHAAGALVADVNLSSTTSIVEKSPAPTFAKKICWMGDSISHAEVVPYDGAVWNFYDPRNSWCYRAAVSLGYDFVDLATQGFTSASLVSQAGDLTTYNPGADYFVLLIGTNDQGSNVSLATYKANVTTIVQAMHAANGAARVIVARPFTPGAAEGGWTNGIGLTTGDYAAALDDVAATETYIELLDLITAAGLDMGLSGADRGDGVHPSISGQTKMGAALATLLADTTPPTIVTRGIQGDTLTVVFSEACLPASADGTEADNNFAVVGNTPFYFANGFTISGSTLTAVLDHAAVYGESVTVSYFAADGTVRDLAGNHMLDDIEQAATNSTVGYTVSGPSSGTTAVASTAFTVTLSGGATFDGSQVIQIDVAAGTITVTTAGDVANDGTNSVAVQPLAAATSFTFTYTPATDGAHTLVFTNGQDWTDPANKTYTGIPLPPDTPTGLALDINPSGIIISWGLMDRATSYTLQRRVHNVGSYVTIATPASAGYLELTAVSGRSYDYRVSASNVGGTSAYTTAVTGTSQGPRLTDSTARRHGHLGHISHLRHLHVF